MSTCTLEKSMRTCRIPSALAPGHFLKPRENFSQDLLVSIWYDQYSVQGRVVGSRGLQGCQHLLVYCLVETSAAAEQPEHAGVCANPCFTSARLRVNESHTILIMPVVVVSALGAAKGSSLHESRGSLVVELASSTTNPHRESS